MNVTQTDMNRSTKVFFVLFFLAIGMSIGLTYYHTVVRAEYTVFTDPDTVPSPTDFFAYLVSTVEPYFQK